MGSAPTTAAQVEAGGGSGGASAVLADPIVAQTNQELAAEQAQPVPTEDEALQAEQHTAWAAYDFERCIVIFSRLLELHPEDPGYKEKLAVSYYNRGKQYETQGDERRATQLYYSALATDPDLTPAQEAAESFLQKVEGEGSSG
jgi:tetratricopeptide (TPR) repeat protein